MPPHLPLPVRDNNHVINLLAERLLATMLAEFQELARIPGSLPAARRKKTRS